jgi:hypothetical protein
MDLKSSIIIGVIILYMLLPFIWIGASNIKRVNRLKKGLFALASESGHQISRLNHWDDSLIGIDDTVNILFFTRRINDSEVSKVIDLAGVQECRRVHSTRTATDKDGKREITERVELVLTYWGKSRDAAVLGFFDAEHELWTETIVLGLTQKWSMIISKAVSEGKEDHKKTTFTAAISC